MSRLGFALLLAATLAPAQSLRLSFDRVPEAVLETRLRLAAPKLKDRLERLRALFAEVGCGPGVLIEQRVPGSREPNLICRVPGATSESAPTPRLLVVGAHYDCAGGDGVIDNWSGVAILPSLYEMLQRHPPAHTVEIVAFAAEERGLLGSKAYVKALSPSARAALDVAITLDSLGLGPIRLWPDSSTPALVPSAYNLARALGLTLMGFNFGGVAASDSVPFHEARLPVLSFHSLSSLDDLKLINSRKDIWSRVRWSDYAESYRYLSALVAYYDQLAPPPSQAR